MYQKILVGFLACWFVGFTTGVGGEFIHLFLIAALTVVVLSLISRSTEPMPKFPRDNNFSGRYEDGYINDLKEVVAQPQAATKQPIGELVTVVEGFNANDIEKAVDGKQQVTSGATKDELATVVGGGYNIADLRKAIEGKPKTNNRHNI